MIGKAVRILRQGGVVAFPTETVYGLGARLFDRAAVRKIYEIKGRPFYNPLIAHISDETQLKTIVREISVQAGKLMKKYWPGPLTIIFRRSSRVPSEVTAGLSTLAVRMPSHPVARELIRSLGEPIAAPSANLSGRPSGTCAREVVRDLGDNVPLVLDCGKTPIGIESTVVDLTKVPPLILRPGFVTYESLKRLLPDLVNCPVRLQAHSSSKRMPSPGMTPSHYKPDCRVLAVPPRDWARTISEWKKRNSCLGILSYRKPVPAGSYVLWKKSSGGSIKRYARDLYSSFLDAERAGVQVLLVESVARRGLGSAVMDRIERASADR